MNVQEVIEEALNGQDGIPVTPATHDVCEDDQVMKLATALNFIGTNLEDSFDKVAEERDERRVKADRQAKARGRTKTASVDGALYHAAQAGKQALLEKNAYSPDLSDAVILGSTLAGGVGAHKARERMRAAGIGEEEINDLVTRTSGAARGAGVSFLAGGLGDLAARKMGVKPGSLGEEIAWMVPSALGGLSAYKSQVNRADRAIKRHKARQKTAAFQKVAEDRINPAKISAGAAAPYSGEVMPSGQAVFGGATTPAQLIAMKAQKVRNRINSDMKKYVKNVGDGYNLQGHLKKFNK